MSATLYYTPTSCGAASVISALRGGILSDSLKGKTKGGLEFNCLIADIRGKKVVSTGEDFLEINPKGNVPCLVVKDADGKTVLNLSEGAAVLQWIADNAPHGDKCAPAYGTNERYVMMHKLNWLASELHKSYGPLFSPTLGEEAREAQKKVIASKVEYLLKHETPAPFLQGTEWTVADAYCYIILSWSGYVGVELPEAIEAYIAAVTALPEVAKAHRLMALTGQ